MKHFDCMFDHLLETMQLFSSWLRLCYHFLFLPVSQDVLLFGIAFQVLVFFPMIMGHLLKRSSRCVYIMQTLIL